MNLIAGILNVDRYKWCYIGQFGKDEEWIHGKVDTIMNGGDIVSPKQIIDTHLENDLGNRLFVYSDESVKASFLAEAKEKRLFDPYNPTR